MDQIPSLVQSNLQAFGNLIPALKLKDAARAGTAQSHLARFKLWVGSLGAQRASGMRSLTYRLRDASTIRSHVISLLKELQSSLEEGLESSQFAARSLLESSQPLGRIQVYDSIDLELADLLGGTGNDLNDESDLVAELSQYLLQVEEIIDCLLRLSVTISNPAPHDQFKSRVNVQTTHFEPYDINHVREKFPKLDPAISQRLGRALTQRRQYFKYREDHHRRLKEGLEPDDARSECGGTTVASSIPQNLRDSAGVNITVPDVPLSEASATSYAQSNIMEESAIRVPPLPKEHTDGPFLCPFCFTIISVDTRYEWKKHVFSDLRPYVCIWNDCILSGQDFQKRKDWIRHMTAHHWREWTCSFGCSTPYDDCRSLETHLKEAHAGELSSKAIDHVSALSSCIDVNKAKGKCPMCWEFEINTIRQYGSHIGHHLEQIALFVLPDTDGYDEIEHESDNSRGNEDDEKEQDNLEHEPRGGSKSAESDVAKIDDTAAYLSDTSSEPSGVVLPPPSPSAYTTLLSTGATGPPDPFVQPPGPDNQNHTSIDTSDSALPSRYMNNEFLPSPRSLLPGSLLPDMYEQDHDSNTVPSSPNSSPSVVEPSLSISREELVNAGKGKGTETISDGSSSEHGTNIEVSGKNIPTAPSMSRFDNQSELGGLYPETYLQPGLQQGHSEAPSGRSIQPNESDDGQESTFGQAKNPPFQTGGQESINSLELSESLAHLSMDAKKNTDILSGGSNRRSRMRASEGPVLQDRIPNQESQSRFNGFFNGEHWLVS